MISDNQVLKFVAHCALLCTMKGKNKNTTSQYAMENPKEKDPINTYSASAKKKIFIF